MEPKRLNKFISDAGFCSRREADRLIEEGRVTVNGKLPDAGTKVTPKDKVRIDDQLLRVREEAPVFLVLHKPAGMSATADMSVRDNVIRALNYPASLQPIGHLDREDEGVLFLSNDSDLVRKLSKAESRMEKELLVTVNKPFSSDFIAKLSEACAIFTEEGTPKKAVVSRETSTRFRIVLEAGMNQHVKKLCEALDYKVTYLQRVRIEQIGLAKLQKGHWRALGAQEVDALKQVAALKPARSAPKGRNETKSFQPREAGSRERKATDRGGYQQPAKAGAAPRGGAGMRVGKSKPAGADKYKGGGPKGKTVGGSFKSGPKKGGTAKGASGRSR